MPAVHPNDVGPTLITLAVGDGSHGGRAVLLLPIYSLPLMWFFAVAAVYIGSLIFPL